MSPFVIGAIVAVIYILVGLFGYALAKTAGNADRVIENMFDTKEDSLVHDD